MSRAANPTARRPTREGPPPVIDLDASRTARSAKREGSKTGVVVRMYDNQFDLPVELPASVVDLLLDGDLDIAGLIRSVVGVWTDNNAAPERREQAEALFMEALLTHPSLPVDVLRTVRSAIATLFGEEQWARFNALNPSVPDLAALIRGLWGEYGVSLGEAWSSPAPSATGGATRNPTSNGSTGSTSAAHGLALANPAS